jgi:hypothetical protein
VLGILEIRSLNYLLRLVWNLISASC